MDRHAVLQNVIAMSINGSWNESDERPNASKDNQIKDYLESLGDS
jgi:hypothetical protein